MKNKVIAGWVSLALAIALSSDAAIARWYPERTAPGTEAVIISALLAFAAAAFGISAYESTRPSAPKGLN